MRNPTTFVTALLIALVCAGCSLFGEDFELGDVNMDHRITSEDAAVVIQSIVDCMTPEIVICSTLTGRKRKLADTNRDKQISPADASLILAWAGGSEDVEQQLTELELIIASRGRR